MAADGGGRPLGMLITAGQRHESTQLGPLLDAIRVPRATSGRPRKRPTHLIADRGYSYTTCRQAAAPAADRPHHPRAVRPAAGSGEAGRQRRPAAKVDPLRYRHRNVVERAIARLKQHRAVATRYDKLAVSYHSLQNLDLASYAMSGEVVTSPPM